jgi:acyl carrier protein
MIAVRKPQSRKPGSFYHYGGVKHSALGLTRAKWLYALAANNIKFRRQKMKRSLKTFALLAALVAFPPKHAFSDTTIDQKILTVIASVLKTTPEKLRPDLPFAKQNPPVDDLSVVETVMAIESELGIEIRDNDLNARAGTAKTEELAEKLTIKQLQSLATELYSEKSER